MVFCFYKYHSNHDMINAGVKIGIVCCSNGQNRKNADNIAHLSQVLVSLGLHPVFSDHIYVSQEGTTSTGQERAKALMDFYRDDEIKGIFDISGGDMANGVLPYLNYEVIADSDKTFWGYSDLTTVINAIYARTGKASVLYQIRNLIYDHGEQQIMDLRNSLICGNDDLFRIDDWLFPGISQTENKESSKKKADSSNDFYHRPTNEKNKKLEGTIVGGNIRCFLKLAGTEYLPNLTDKLLLLESYSGTTELMESYLSQLEQLGAFRKVAGILLGTFTEMQEKNINQLLKHLSENMPETICQLQLQNKSDMGQIQRGFG